MEVTDRTHTEGISSSPGSAYRPRPFVTILDGDKKTSPSPRHAKPSIRRPVTRKRTQYLGEKKNPFSFNGLKKNGVKVNSYMQEGSLVFTRSLREVISRVIQSAASALRTVSGLPSRLAGWVKSQRNAKIEKVSKTAKVARVSLSARVARFMPALDSLLRVPRKKLAQLLVIGLIVLTTISVGARAIIAAARFPIGANALTLPDEESVQAALIAYLEPDKASDDALPSGKLAPLPVSVTITSYTIRAGDTLEKIAKRFGLRQDSIISANNLTSQSAIRAGTQLRIPNIDGISHKVKRGENLSLIAKAYGVDMTTLLDANDLASSTISTGQSLFIPNAKLSSATLREFYGERFVWPVRGSISSPYGYRANPFTGLRTFHAAIDIVVSVGTRIKSTSDGQVADTGYNSVFGNYVILKHASGYQSLYAHLSSISVREGSSVVQGATIGLSGNTGQSTGPHLHFSLFKNGQALDPAKYLK